MNYGSWSREKWNHIDVNLNCNSKIASKRVIIRFRFPDHPSMFLVSCSNSNMHLEWMCDTNTWYRVIKSGRESIPRISYRSWKTNVFLSNITFPQRDTYTHINARSWISAGFAFSRNESKHWWSSRWANIRVIASWSKWKYSHARKRLANSTKRTVNIFSERVISWLANGGWSCNCQYLPESSFHTIP